MQSPRFLMCPPTFFGVEYIINPWMEGQVHATNLSLAHQQWIALHDLLAAQGAVFSMTAVKGLPDLVFTANAGLVYGRCAIVSSFRCAERQPESSHFAASFEAHGFEVHHLSGGVNFEGAGDALFSRSEPLLWMGHGMRSSREACEPVQKLVDVEVQPLRLRNPSFYHLDTCFCPLERGYLLYYPDAFDEAGLGTIEKRVPAEKRIAVDHDDAAKFACNAVNVGRTVIANSFSNDLALRLYDAGFTTITTPLSEFMRSGGAAKCLSLRLNED